MNQLQIKPVVKTVTIFVGIVSLLCAIFVVVARDVALKFFNTWMHGIDLSKIAAPTPSIGSIIGGVISLLVVTALATGLFVKLWNKMHQEEKQ